MPIVEGWIVQIRGGDYGDGMGVGDTEGGFGEVFVDEIERGVSKDAVETATGPGEEREIRAAFVAYRAFR